MSKFDPPGEIKKRLLVYESGHTALAEGGIQIEINDQKPSISYDITNTPDVEVKNAIKNKNLRKKLKIVELIPKYKTDRRIQSEDIVK